MRISPTASRATNDGRNLSIWFSASLSAFNVSHSKDTAGGFTPELWPLLASRTISLSHLNRIKIHKYKNKLQILPIFRSKQITQRVKHEEQASNPNVQVKFFRKASTTSSIPLICQCCDHQHMNRVIYALPYRICGETLELKPVDSICITICTRTEVFQLINYWDYPTKHVSSDLTLIILESLFISPPGLSQCAMVI